MYSSITEHYVGPPLYNFLNVRSPAASTDIPLVYSSSMFEMSDSSASDLQAVI